MCLIKDKRHHPFNRPLIAEEDIVCYKLLQINHFKSEIVTPYTKIPVPIKCIQEIDKRIPFKAEISNKFEFIWRHVLGFSNIVGNGFIHTFSKELPDDCICSCEGVFKCIIPKGTKYFVGERESQYASEQIIFGERLK